MLEDSGHTSLALSPSLGLKEEERLACNGRKDQYFYPKKRKKKKACHAFHKNYFFYYFPKSISLVFSKKYAAAIL